jgi:DNA-binding NarL/FixJ family response regulator
MSTTERAPRVLLVDDQELVRAGFRLILTSRDIEVAGEAADGTEAVLRARQLQPDVVLMDIRMPNMDGLEATRRILQDNPACKVVILTTFDLDRYVYDALAAGASGFLLKDVTPQHLAAAVRLVNTGDALLAPAITRRLVARYAGEHPSRKTGARATDLAHLTPRELEVLTHLGSGLSNAELAETLILSEATVKTHVARIFAKLGLRDRAQAVVVAYEAGLVMPDHNDPRE